MARLTRTEVSELADEVHALLAAVASGELVVSSATRHRLEGALVALEAVDGQADLRTLLGEDGGYANQTE